MQKYKEIIVLVLLAVSYARPLAASPFCVETQGIPPQCIYDDAVMCRQRADQLKGLCVVNQAELAIPPGIGKYCLVDSDRIVQCDYNDRTSCIADAVRGGAICIDAPDRNILQDPYRKEPNVNY